MHRLIDTTVEVVFANFIVLVNVLMNRNTKFVNVQPVKKIFGLINLAAREFTVRLNALKEIPAWFAELLLPAEIKSMAVFENFVGENVPAFLMLQ
jgi:hypothetical protein